MADIFQLGFLSHVSASVDLDTERDIRITISIGVAMLTPQCLDLDALLQQADKGLYQAKHSGRNAVSLCV